MRNFILHYDLISEFGKVEPEIVDILPVTKYKLTYLNDVHV